MVDIPTVSTNDVLALGAAAAVGAVVGAGATAIVMGGSDKPKRKKSKKKKTSRKGKARRSRKRSPKYARTAGKGRDTSRRRIRMTKNGQPYIILASGKARFISKASARNSRRRKGGRY